MSKYFLRTGLVRPFFRVDSYPVKRAWDYLVRLYLKFLDDGAPLFGAGIAYAALFSIFPLALLALSVMGYVIASEQRQEEFIRVAIDALPVGLGDIVKSNVRDIVGGRGTSGLLAALGLLIAAIGVFGALQYSLNRIFDCVTGYSPLRSIARQLILMGAIFILFILAFIATSSGQVAAALVTTDVVGEAAARWIRLAGSTAISVVLGTLFIGACLRIVPHKPPVLREVFPVALVAALALEASKVLFGFYLQSLARYTVIYGSVGAVAALLSWIYIAVTIVLIAAEVISLRGQRADVRKTVDNPEH